MNHAPLISIITISYNAADVIAPTMASVAGQSFRDFEHLLIDGKSTDNTVEIAENFHSDELIIVSEPDKGIYDAMNKGLRKARGKYVIFLNAGDAFHSPDVLAAYAKAAHSDADIICADTVIVDFDRNFLAPRHLSAPDPLTFRSFSRGMLVCHQAFMVKKGLAPEYDTSYRFSADYDWTVKCLANSNPDKCVNLHTIAIDYLADGTTDRNKIKSLLERFRIMSKHYGLLPTITNHFSFLVRAFRRFGLFF